jgi:hypothetical protein
MLYFVVGNHNKTTFVYSTAYELYMEQMIKEMLFMEAKVSQLQKEKSDFSFQTVSQNI